MQLSYGGIISILSQNGHLWTWTQSRQLERCTVPNAAKLRLDFGPGYRVYFGKDGEALVILLGGGTKKRQQADIADAQMLWREYKRRKAED